MIVRCWLPALLACLAVLPAFAADPAAARAELATLANRAERELRDNILPYWLAHAPAAGRGGFIGFVDDRGRPRPDAPRAALMTCRILWTFSAAHRHQADPAHLEMARRAWRDLTETFTDPDHGGLFWTATAAGRPLDTRKQVYGQVFGIYALAEFHRATGEPAALEQAVALYRLLEKHARDREHGGYYDLFDRQWRRGRDRDNVLGRYPKTQNSHIHILEAFTNLLRAWPDPALRESQRALIDVIVDRIVDPRTGHLRLFFKPDWTPVGDDISYGHDIELSWLLTEAADVLGDPAVVARVRPVALRIAAATLAEGVAADGGVVNEGDAHGVTNAGKDWWSQAEAAVGFVNAWQLSGDTRYLAAARRTWDFIEAKIVDREHGDWVQTVTEAGRPVTGPKVGMWKCPYHNGRACLELVERARVDR